MNADVRRAPRWSSRSSEEDCATCCAKQKRSLTRLDIAEKEMDEEDAGEDAFGVARCGPLAAVGQRRR